MRLTLFKFIFIGLLIIIVAGCTGGEKPVETSPPETTAPPPTTTMAPPTSAPPTTAPPPPAIDLSSPETPFKKLLPPGYVSITELTEASVIYDLRYPAPPKSYEDGIEAKYPPKMQTINRPYPYSDSYTIERKQGSVNILKFKTEGDARDYYQDITGSMTRRTDFNPRREEIKMNGKSLFVDHKLKDKRYHATLIQKGIFIFQINPGVETKEDAEAYILGNMDYLFE
jgi:hypothetical protein